MHVSAMQMKPVFLVFTKIVPKYLSLTCTIHYHLFLHKPLHNFSSPQISQYMWDIIMTPLCTIGSLLAIASHHQSS